MELNVYKDLNDRGIIRFFDGTLIYVEEIQYSADGKTYWENTFNPESHVSTLDNITIVAGHKYRRTRNANETKWNLPAKWVPEDGQELMIRVEGDVLQTKLELATTWVDLYDLTLLQGEVGPQGEMGQGWEIDRAGALDTRGSCCNTATISSCNTCNPNSTSGTSILSTYMSLGNHKITLLDIGTGSNYWHSLDGTTFVQTTSDNEGDYVCSWKGTDGSGTASLTCNSQGVEVALASLVTPYVSKGKVYICADSNWVELMNVTTPTGLIKVEALDSLGYLENKVDDVTIEAFDSDLDAINDSIRIKDDGVNEDKIVSTSIGDGLIGGSGDIIEVDATDFVGFGLREYTSGDTTEDIQVFVDDIIGDGLISYDDSLNQADGEDRNLARVNVDDIISPTTGLFTGLETSTDAGITETDGFDNIYVKPGDCIEVDTDGINVKADELSLIADGLTELAVKPYAAGNDGIMAVHLNPDVANTLAGIDVDNTTGIEVKVDASTIGFDGTGNLEVIDNGITGDKLNDNVADNTAGIEVLNDLLTVKVDGSTIDFNGSGELEVLPGSIASDIAGTSDVVVKSITAKDNGITGNTVRDNVILEVTDGTGINTTLTGTVVTDTLQLTVDFDTAWGDARYELAGGGAPIAATAWGDITGTVTDQTDLVAYIDSLKHVKLNNWYENIMVSDGTGGTYSTVGLLIKAPSGTKAYKLIIDENGVLDSSLAS